MSLKSLFSAKDMTLGSPWKRIMEFSIPMLLGNVAQQLYNTADSIIVEGHTDPVGDYNYNQGLSLRRAENVMAFCQSAESGLDAAQLELLSGILEAVGYSCDRPVYDENGQVDNDASRRVSFRFVINIGN